MRAADLPRDLQKRLLGKTVSKAAVPSEGEALFLYQAKVMGFPPVEQQYLFAKEQGRKFAADFSFVAAGYPLLVEIQGGIWRKGGGAHSRPAKIEKDLERQQYAVLLGLSMLPFTTDEVFSGHAIGWTQKVLTRMGWKP